MGDEVEVTEVTVKWARSVAEQLLDHAEGDSASCGSPARPRRREGTEVNAAMCATGRPTRPRVEAQRACANSAKQEAAALASAAKAEPRPAVRRSGRWNLRKTTLGTTTEHPLARVWR